MDDKEFSIKMKKSEMIKNIENPSAAFNTSWPKSLRQWWQNSHWSVMLIGVVIVFMLGNFGFYEAKKTFSPWDILYRIIQLFVLNFDTSISDLNWKVELARWLAPGIAAYAGIRALLAIFSEQFQLLKIRFQRNHIIICGLGRKGCCCL